MKFNQPQAFVVDCGRADTTREFLAQCANQGIEMEVKNPCSPWQKGRVERAFLNARASAPKA